MEKTFTEQFSIEWVEAWNSHDINKIMSHYTDDFIMHSPVIQELLNEPSGKLSGKSEIKKYWLKALKLNPMLHFEIISVYKGVNSIVINYKGHRGLSAEVFHFNRNGKVKESYAHYEI